MHVLYDPTTINSNDRRQFDELGLLNPEHLFTQEECLQFLQALNVNFNLLSPSTWGSPKPEWIKGHAAASRVVYELATQKQIIDRLKMLLGNDVMLWGACLVRKSASEAHPWHTDIESWNAGGKLVSVWIGLNNTSRESSLRVVSCSHKFGVSVQQLRHEARRRREELKDDEIIAWAKKCEPQSELVLFDISDGQALFYDGRLWHASHNHTGNDRQAVLLQYATPDSVIRIPDLRTLDWPFRYLGQKPPCLMVSGGDTAGVNRMVNAPSSKPGKSGLTGLLTSQTHCLQVPLPADSKNGWKMYPFFNGPTRSLDVLRSHSSVLKHDCCPHPPHRHLEEELLMVLDGEVEVNLPDLPDSEQYRRLKAGDLVYYPVSFAHTVKTVSKAPANYMMLKWVDRSAKDQCYPTMSFGQYNYKALQPARVVTQENGFSFQILFEGTTLYLQKLHCHYSTLCPGGGYKPHCDPYDVVLVILEGQVETLGELHTPHSAVYYAAGEPHGIMNRGDVDAKYLVFEFHGRRNCVADPSSKSLASKLVDPACWKRLIKRIAAAGTH